MQEAEINRKPEPKNKAKTGSEEARVIKLVRGSACGFETCNFCLY